MGLLVDDFNRLTAAAAQGKVLLNAGRRFPGEISGKGGGTARSRGANRSQPCGMSRARAVTRHASSDFVGRHYEVIREIGRGSFSRVQLVRERRTGHERVCKVVDTREMAEEVLQLTRAEIKVLSDLDHPSVVKLYEYADDPAKHRLVLILEYIAGGDCSGLLAETEEQLSEVRVARLVQQLLVAVNCCHSRDIVHRDIKPQNMMLTRNIGAWGCPDLKMIDFGLAACMKTSRDFVGTPAYMPPEVLSGHVDYTSQVDMWSIGCTVMELLTGETPFGKPEDFGGDMDPVFEAIRDYKSFDDISAAMEELSGWTERADEARDFVQRLLRADPSRRMTAMQALNHPWIARHTPLQTGLTADLVRSMADYSSMPLFLRCCLFIIMARSGGAEQGRVGAAFADADADGSGLVSLEELVDAFQGASVCGWGASRVDASTVLAGCDLGGTGRLSLTEFAAACSFTRLGRNIERLADLSFAALDSDREDQVWMSDVRALFPGQTLEAMADLPQDKPFGAQEWRSCLRSVAASSAVCDKSAGCRFPGSWAEADEDEPRNPLMRFLKALMCEQLLCNGCEQYRDDEDTTLGDAPVVLCHNYDPNLEVPIPEYKVPDIPARMANTGSTLDFEVVRSFPKRGASRV